MESSSSSDNSSSSVESWGVALCAFGSASFSWIFCAVEADLAGCFFLFSTKNTAPPNNSINANIPITAVNTLLDKNEPCCTSSSCSAALVLANNSWVKRSISAICGLMSSPLATSFCIVSSFSSKLDSFFRNATFSFKIACKPSIESDTSF